jgi:hypothetical protein
VLPTAKRLEMGKFLTYLPCAPCACWNFISELSGWVSGAEREFYIGLCVRV